ncbi:hypothetical protein LXL04_006859 [Taraxacum kok-saghyz]
MKNQTMVSGSIRVQNSEAPCLENWVAEDAVVISSERNRTRNLANGEDLRENIARTYQGCIDVLFKLRRSSSQGQFFRLSRNVNKLRPLMVSKLLSWFKKKKKKKILISKVDFEKALDSVGGIFQNARSSVLINGIPSTEFESHKGLRQRDPFSPFLFIIAMEGLHVAMMDVVLPGVFRGVSLRSDGVIISHQFFWFYLTSGLKINPSKSNLLGVAVPDIQISSGIFWPLEFAAGFLHSVPFASDKVGTWRCRWTIPFSLRYVDECSMGSFPFTYLGVPIRASMARISGWKDSYRRFWSFGVYVCSFFLGAEEGERNGLGLEVLMLLISCYFIKWRWRFHNEPNALLDHLIKFLYGEGGKDGGLHGSDSILGAGVWAKIVGSINRLHNQGVVAFSAMSRILGDGHLTICWHDIWCRDKSLRLYFPRLFALTLSLRKVGWLILGGSSQIANLMDLLHPVSLTSNHDKWQWSLDPSYCYFVKLVRSWIDATGLPAGDVVTRRNTLRRNKCVPIKINVFCWWVHLDRLPCRFNLAARGLPLESLLCPICLESQEKLSYLLFTCSTVVQVWRKIACWVQRPVPPFASMSDLVE